VDPLREVEADRGGHDAGGQHVEATRPRNDHAEPGGGQARVDAQDAGTGRRERCRLRRQ
jgi:hypothetical protein